MIWNDFHDHLEIIEKSNESAISHKLHGQTI